MARAAVQPTPLPLTVQLEPVLHISDDELFELSRINRDLRLERTARGELVIMTPTGGLAGGRSAELMFQLAAWARRDGTGVAFESSTGFRLPNGAVRSPDAAWVRRERLALLSPEEKAGFLPLCPDFVVELRSFSDPLPLLQDKLAEYVANGARLGLLIDPDEGRVSVYREEGTVEVLEEPSSVSGDPVLPGFRLELAMIWSPDW
ncbi:MAG: Uma2 family endonuclease [Thermoanaerobaculia bacterium]